MGRIGSTDSFATICAKLCEGNPGAVSVLMHLIKSTAMIDPDAALREMHYVFMLDTLNIYGPKIWVLYKDICSQNIGNVIAILRAWQLGLVAQADISRAIDDARRVEGAFKLDVVALVKKVKEQVPNFREPAA